MTANDIESIAIDTLKRELRKHIEMFTPHLQENDKTPFWDGEIWVYKDANKTKKDYADRIFVQVKGTIVGKMKKGNSKFSMEVETLRGFQKDKRGTLLFVTEIEDSEHTQLYYANLLPVDLKEILDRVKEEQQKVTIDIKPIVDKTSSSIKFVCLNFLKNSDEQLNIAIKNVEDIKNIKEIKVPIECEESLMEEYFLNNDIYSYAYTIQNEKFALPKIVGIHEFNKTKRIIKIEDKVYYNTITKITSKKESYILFGKSIKLYLSENKIDIKIQGNLYTRINDIEFILDLVNKKSFSADSEKINFPINVKSKKEKEVIERLKENLEYLKEVKKVFDKFNIKFDVDWENLTEIDYKNISLLMSIVKGNIPATIEKTGAYNIKIAEYKIVFLVMIKENGQKEIYNYFENLENIMKVFYFNDDGKEVPLSVYIKMTKKDFLGFSNINFEIIKNSFENIDYSEASLVKINEFFLEVLKAYDYKKDKELLNLADFIINKILKYSQEYVYIINKMQLILRERKLTKEEKETLYRIKEKSDDKQIQLAIAILLNNKSDCEMYLEKLTADEKDFFYKFPIANLIEQG